MFVVVGSLAALFFVVTEVGSLLLWYFYSSYFGMPDGVLGGFIYFGIALVCFFAVWRMRAPSKRPQ